jgi:hypothetical protein
MMIFDFFSHEYRSRDYVPGTVCTVPDLSTAFVSIPFTVSQPFVAQRSAAQRIVCSSSSQDSPQGRVKKTKTDEK